MARVALTSSVGTSDAEHLPSHWPAAPLCPGPISTIHQGMYKTRVGVKLTQALELKRARPRGNAKTLAEAPLGWHCAILIDLAPAQEEQGSSRYNTGAPRPLWGGVTGTRPAGETAKGPAGAAARGLAGAAAGSWKGTWNLRNLSPPWPVR